MYKIVDNHDMKKALVLADEYNYNSKTEKIAVGIIYQEEKECMEEEYPQLKKLCEQKTSWKGMK
jgi:hypothetical protein